MPPAAPGESSPESPQGDPLPSRFSIGGMTCNNCVRHVTQAILAVPGVATADVSLDARQAVVEWAPASPQNPARVVEAVAQAGFEARLLETTSPEASPGGHGGNAWRTTLWVGAAGTLPLLAGEWVFGLGALPWFQWLSCALAATVQVVAGSRFYRGAWSQLRFRSANMDTLVSLGSTTAFVFSLWTLLHGGASHLYFMEAASILTLVSCGHWLESRMSERASGSLRKLLHLAPAQARRRLPDGSENMVAVAKLTQGDTVILRPGDRVPADGEVIEGGSAVDESMLTGEPIPTEKSLGAKVYAGTLNLNGHLVIRVTASGQATALAAIIAAVRRAQDSRAAIQRLGDRVSSVFVPIVILVALATGFWWGLAPESAQQACQWVAGVFGWHVPALTAATAAFIHAAAVLIVACPCAMGLATPVAIMAGANAAAERGILIRDGVALEKAGRITTVVFDKTGTLTVGQPVVTDTAAYPSRDHPSLSVKGLAAEMARHSNHPLSQAIARLQSDPVAVQDWTEVRGSGIQGRLPLPVQPARLGAARLGSLPWLQAQGVNLTEGAVFIEKWAVQGASVLGLAVEQHLLALFALQDSLRLEVPRVVAELGRHGYSVRMVTGDQNRTAQAIGSQAGIASSNIHAEVRPEEKARLLIQFQQDGQRVAFVGDGINDAPALEQADLGIAVSRASDLALEAADIVLLRADLEAVPESLGLARATLRTIKQNLFWAFFYNALGIPLAALGLLNPMICAAAMGLSDVIVIGNALRLRHRRRGHPSSRNLAS
jgi:P-type Cu+ transporter